MSEDAPQFTPTDESQRIEDPEKAHTMALAGNAFRSGAAENRQNADEWRGSGTTDSFLLGRRADELAEGYDRTANRLEEEAGSQYDAEKAATTQIPVTEETDNQSHDRVEDLEKARVMAEAGDEERTRASQYRAEANAAEHDLTHGPHTDDEGRDLAESAYSAMDSASNAASFADQQANRLEEEAGKRYDSGEVVTPTVEASPQSDGSEQQTVETTTEHPKKKLSPEEARQRIGEIKAKQADLRAQELGLDKELQRLKREHRELSQTVEHADGSITVIEPDGEEWLRHSPTSGLWYSGPDDYVGQYD